MHILFKNSHMKCSVSALGLGCFSLCPRKTIYFLFFPFAQLRLAALHVAFHCHFLLLYYIHIKWLRRWQKTELCDIHALDFGRFFRNVFVRKED